MTTLARPTCNTANTTAVALALLAVAAFGPTADARQAQPSRGSTVTSAPAGSAPTSAAAQQLAKGRAVWENLELRIYDLRDLEARLGRWRDGAHHLGPPSAAAAGAGGQAVVAAAVDPHSGAPVTIWSSPEARRQRMLLETLVEHLNMSVRELQPGLYLVTGAPESHAALQPLLAGLRDAAAEMYQVQLQVHTVAADQAPAVGSAWPARPAEATAQLTAAVPRRTTVPVHSLRQVSSISEWSPVVGNNAVGYEAKVRQADEGLSLRMTIGAGPDDDAGELVQISGHITQLRLVDTPSPAMSPDGRNLLVQLPHKQVRTVSADLRIPRDRPTIVATMTGFEPGEVLVIVATVQRGMAN